MFLKNVEGALLIETSVCLLMAEPAGDAEVFVGGLEDECSGKDCFFDTGQVDSLNLIVN